MVDLPRRTLNGEPIDLEPIEREFFDGLKVGNGTYKTTSRFRLDDVNRVFVSLLGSDQARELEVLDVAASSGVTSLRWLELLRASGFTPHMTISDITAFAYLATPVPWFRVLVDHRNKPLEFEVCSRPVRGRIKKIDLLTGRVLLILAASVLYRCLGLISRTGVARGSDGLGPLVETATVKRLPLVSNDVRRHRDMSVTEDDITAADLGQMTGMFDVIRAANILQTVYFSEPIIRRGIAILKRRLKGDGAWLIVCRTRDDGVNHASVFRLEDGRFVVKSRVGDGSEIEDLVLAT
ncbi:MAG TPA: hypothetical protein VIY09_00620 [Rhizomicrobium sp.]